jgi:NADH:ubiquinone oxidoreductase subunit
MAYRPGRLSQMWTNLKKSLVIFRSKDQYIGSDEFGNKYFEKLYDAKNDIKAQRRVEPKDPDQFKVPTVPVEWMTWLQGRRSDPPTEQEREANKVTTLKTLGRSEKLARHRMEESKKNEMEDTTLLKPQQKSSSQFPVYPGFEIHPGETEAKKKQEH